MGTCQVYEWRAVSLNTCGLANGFVQTSEARAEHQQHDPKSDGIKTDDPANRH